MDEIKPIKWYKTPIDKYYNLYDSPADEVKDEGYMAQFKTLLGGDQKIDMISYNVTDNQGGVITKFVPGQVSYAPVKLYRVIDAKAEPLIDWFNMVWQGRIHEAKKNVSIVQFDYQGNWLITWDLINAVPISQPGFSYNSYRGTTSTKYKIEIQAEEIIITFQE